MIPNGVDIPAEVGAPAEPPHVLYVGRLSEEKGILDFVEATEGLAAGRSSATGRCATACPRRSGFVPPIELGAYYERAAVVCVPSRREGYGVVAREAMAYGRPVVATAGRRARGRGRGRRHRPARPAGRRGGASRRRSRGSSTTTRSAPSSATNARAHAEATYSWALATGSLLSAYADALRRTT